MNRNKIQLRKKRKCAGGFSSAGKPSRVSCLRLKLQRKERPHLKTVLERRKRTRRLAEKETGGKERESSRRFRAIFESSRDAMMTIDPPSWKFTSANISMVRMFKAKSKAELFSCKPWELSPARQSDGRVSSEKARKMIRIAARKGSHFFEWTHRRIDGTTFPAEVLLTRVMKKGGAFIQATVRDVTDRKKGEHDLLASETRYRRLFESSKDGILILNLGTGTIEDVNPFLAKMLGYAHKAFLGKKLWEVGAFKDTQKCKSAFRELQKRKYFRCDNMALETKAGRSIQAEFVSSVYRIDGVQVIQCNIRDITQREGAIETLRKSEARFRSYFDLPLHGIAITSPEKAWLQVNERVCSILGYPRKELLRKTWSEMTHPDDLKADAQQFKRVLSGEIERYSMDKRFIRKDGKIIWTSLAVGCVRKSDGEVDYICALLEDITDRKMAEEALRESKAQRDLALRAARMGVWQFNLVENKRYFDDQVCHLLGLDPAAFSGTAEEFFGTVHPEDRAGIKAALAQTLAKDVLYDPEYRVVWPDKSVHHVSSRGKLVRDREGHPWRINGVLWDVSEQKAAEEFRNDIIRTVSHELRTPLSIEKEGISLLVDGLAGPVTVEQREILGTVMRSIDRLSRMITSLLDISNIETGKIVLSKEGVDLAELVKDIVFEFKKRADEKGIDLGVKLPGSAVRIFADPDKIMQVLSNLVDNAIKFTGKGSVEISLAVLKDAVECQVRDSGVGIAPKNVGKLFEKFQQFSRTSGSGEKGLGLGLSIVKGIIQLHGGRIWAHSELGLGTRVTFSLPLLSEKGVS